MPEQSKRRDKVNSQSHDVVMRGDILHDACMVVPDRRMRHCPLHVPSIYAPIMVVLTAK